MAPLRGHSKQCLLVNRGGDSSIPSLRRLVTGVGTNLFDTLSIGPLATTTTIFKLSRMVRDELFPGTTNVRHTLPIVLQGI
jgi:hypothetical protein